MFSQSDNLESEWTKKKDLGNIGISIKNLIEIVLNEAFAMDTRTLKYADLTDELVNNRDPCGVYICLLTTTDRKHNYVTKKLGYFRLKIKEIVDKTLDGRNLLGMENSQFKKIAMDDEKGMLKKLNEATVIFAEQKMAAKTLKSVWDAVKGDLSKEIDDGIRWAEELLQMKFPNITETVNECYAMLVKLNEEGEEFKQKTLEHSKSERELLLYLKSKETQFQHIWLLFYEELEKQHDLFKAKLMAEKKNLTNIDKAGMAITKYQEEWNQLISKCQKEILTLEERRNALHRFNKFGDKVGKLLTQVKTLRQKWDEMKLMEFVDDITIRAKNLL